jgi:hypothetical protein
MLVDQLVLVLATGALAAGASRIARGIVSPPPGPAPAQVSIAEWALVTAALAGAFVVCWTLALGLAGLAGSISALAAGPIVGWAVTRWLMPGMPGGILAAMFDRWARASALQRAVTLGLVGLLAGAVVEVARQPAFGVDAVAYHLPDVLGWLHSGHAGAVQTFSYDFPVGYYPVTTEVLLTWPLGISRSFAPLAAFSPAFAGLTLLGLWRLLAKLRVPRGVALSSLAAFATLPVFLVGLIATGVGTDLPAVAWLSCTAALSAGAAERPALLGPALLAAGLGVGTKTTVAPLAAAALLAGAWGARRALRPARGWLTLGAVGALLVGGPWYVRDALSHGWPLWPFNSGPGGDPLPHAMKLFDASFLSRPGPTVSASPSLYLKWLAGGLGMMVGALAIPLLARSRTALLAAALALASLLAWAAAPFTGIAPSPLLAPLALTTLRYLLAAFGACAVAVALAGRDASPVGRRVVICLFGAAIVGSLIADLALGYPAVPRLQYLIAGAVVGVAAGALWPRAALSAPSKLTDASVRGLGGGSVLVSLRVLAGLLAAVLLALAGPNWLWRELKAGTSEAPVVAFMLAQPGFASGNQPIASAPAVLATLAGPRLRHPISLIAANEPCARVKARLSSGWVVVWPHEYAPGITTTFDAAQCLQGVRPVFDDGNSLIYTSLRAP